MNKREIGTEYEEKAVAFLENRGYFILERNFRNRIGEIDIIARHHEYLVFIEVKYRKNIRSGRPEEAVTSAKMRTICKVADYYRMRYGFGDDTPCRFDVVAIVGEEIRIFENAFAYCK